MENPKKIDDLGETPILGDLYFCEFMVNCFLPRGVRVSHHVSPVDPGVSDSLPSAQALSLSPSHISVEDGSLVILVG